MTAKRPRVSMAAVRKEAARRAEGFRMIGAFVFEFSQLEYSLRDVLARLLKLKDRHFDIITSPYDFAMLCKVTKSILVQNFPEKLRRIDQLFKECFRINDENTKVAHGMWTFGPDGLVVRHVSRNSLKPMLSYESLEELIVLAEEAKRLIVVLYNLCRKDDATVKVVGVEHLPPKPPRKRAPKANR